MKNISNIQCGKARGKCEVHIGLWETFRSNNLSSHFSATCNGDVADDVFVFICQVSCTLTLTVPPRTGRLQQCK